MTTEDLIKLMGDFPEINPSNYGDDDVNALNAWGIAAHTALEALGREVEQWKVDFNEVLIERDQARAQLAALQVDDELPEPAVGFDYDYYEGLIRYEAPVPRFCETSYYTADQLRQAQSKVRAKMVPMERAQGEAPVAYIAWKDGKPCYEGDDAICEDAVWPVDYEDDRTSMPVYTHPQASEPHPDEFLCPSCIDGKQAYTPPGQASEPAPSTAGARHSAIDAAMGITGEPK